MAPKVDNSMNVNLQDIKRRSPMTTTPHVPELASKRQVRGAAWAGGIAGLCVGGPIGAILLCWGGMHLAKKNDGDAGDFCRKAGDFTFRMEIPSRESGRRLIQSTAKPKYKCKGKQSISVERM
ncbi:hypothetical protein MHU86_16474 [Fragilaria crotonensis]|nr:hypothetical protein MHU86_16474 [Fragilaria crotonensis]